MTKTRRALAFSVGGNYLLFGITFVSTIVLSRLLTPEEVGVFAVAAALTTLLQALKNFGISRYLVQEPELTSERMRSALMLSMLTSWGLAAAMLIASDPVGALFDSPVVTEIIRVLTIPLFIHPFGQIVRGILSREMNFGKIVVADVIAGFVGAITSIVLAMYGFSSISLAWGPAVTGVVATFVLIWLVKPEMDTFIPSRQEVPRIFRFGSRTFLSNVITNVGEGSVEMIVGKFIGFNAAGLYTRAYGLATVFSRFGFTAIQQVAFSHLSAENRSQADLAYPYLKILDYSMVIGFPFFAVLAVLSHEAVDLLYGEKWHDAAAILQILCIAIPMQLIASIVTLVIIAQGRVGDELKGRFFWQAVKLALVILAAFAGLTFVAWAIVLGDLIGLVIMRWLLTSHVKIKIKITAELGCLARNLAIASLCMGAVTGAQVLVPADSDSALLLILSLGFAGIAAAIAWIAGLVFLRHAMFDEIKALSRKWLLSRQ